MEIRYRPGPNNVRADMLSRIRAPEVAVMDAEDYVALQTVEDIEGAHIPLLADGLDKDKIRRC